MILVSKPEATLICGPRYYIEIFNLISSSTNSEKVILWIDCGKNEGLALAAIRDGAKHIIFYGKNFNSINEIAIEAGVQLLNKPPDTEDI